jgi:hypothetical protein
MLKTSIPHEKSYDFSIYRILGGELPPRDKPGIRMETLKFILEKEPSFPNTHKSWLLNAIPDEEYLRSLCGMLQSYGADYRILHLDRLSYNAAQSIEDKILQAIPINKARNMAFSLGKEVARFTAILDGDCYFDKDTWEMMSRFIKRDQHRNSSLQYYAVPHIRSSIEHVTNNEPLGSLGEPMLIMRDDALIGFDESIPFGKQDKLNLLYKLGYCREPMKGHVLVTEGLCKTVGHVHHLATGDELTETDVRHRIRLRKESVENLLRSLDAK